MSNRRTLVLDRLASGVQDRIGARLDEHAARALVRYCSQNGVSQSEALRRALVQLSKTDPVDRQIADLIAVLGLKPNASSQEVIGAVTALLEPEEPPGAAAGRATSPNADALPPAIAKASRAVQDKFRGMQADRAKQRAQATKGKSR